jgi:hypothetical protein
MGQTAIFKIYENGKFLLGSWVKYDGGVSEHSIFPYVMKNADINEHKSLKYSYYSIINEYLLKNKFRRIGLGCPDKNPFQSQINDEGMTAVEVLFWDKPLSDAKLWKQYIAGQFVYEIRFTKNQFKVKVDYNGNTKEWVCKDDNNHNYFITNMLEELVEWIDDIEYGLNDCDCDDK